MRKGTDGTDFSEILPYFLKIHIRGQCLFVLPKLLEAQGEGLRVQHLNKCGMKEKQKSPGWSEAEST